MKVTVRNEVEAPTTEQARVWLKANGWESGPNRMSDKGVEMLTWRLNDRVEVCLPASETVEGFDGYLERFLNRVAFFTFSPRPLLTGDVCAAMTGGDQSLVNLCTANFGLGSALVDAYIHISELESRLGVSSERLGMKIVTQCRVTAPSLTQARTWLTNNGWTLATGPQPRPNPETDGLERWTTNGTNSHADLPVLIEGREKEFALNFEFFLNDVVDGMVHRDANAERLPGDVWFEMLFGDLATKGAEVAEAARKAASSSNVECGVHNGIRVCDMCGDDLKLPRGDLYGDKR